MIKGRDPARIRLGNSLSADEFPGERFDYMIATAPFGSTGNAYRSSSPANATNSAPAVALAPVCPWSAKAACCSFSTSSAR